MEWIKFLRTEGWMLHNSILTTLHFNCLRSGVQLTVDLPIQYPITIRNRNEAWWIKEGGPLFFLLKDGKIIGAPFLAYIVWNKGVPFCMNTISERRLRYIHNTYVQIRTWKISVCSIFFKFSHSSKGMLAYFLANYSLLLPCWSFLSLLPQCSLLDSHQLSLLCVVLAPRVQTPVNSDSLWPF